MSSTSSNRRKVWVRIAACHSYFPQINTGKFILVYEDEAEAVERRRRIVDQFFREGLPDGQAPRDV